MSTCCTPRWTRGSNIRARANELRPEDPVSTIEYRAELSRAGANVASRWGVVRFFARRYLLGAAGGVMMAASLGPSLHNTIIAISIPLIPYSARVVRASTLSLREQPFVESAKAIGMSEVRIALRHVLPNTLAPLIVLATAQFGSTILTEATLSFLGLGIPEPHPSWGRMLSESAAEYVRTAPWLVIFPGLAISFVVFGTNLLGGALRDILDPRQRS